MKKYLLSVICFLLSVTCHLQPVSATIPAGYYDSADGKKGDAICEALHKKIKDHTSLGYDNLYSMYQTSDMTSQGYIWDMYSTCDFANPGDKCGSYKRVCDCFNREHSVPASWFGDANPMYCDPFHVVPTDGYVNNQRSNYALGECANGERLSGGSLCKLGTSTFEGYTSVGKVFEVDDQYKGDFARAYFYMVTCYRDKNFTKAGGGSTMFTYSDSKAGLTAYTIALMLKWHRQDPVSDKEIHRNDAIYAKQGNRNPFIDYPCLAEYIWGDYKTEVLDLSTLMASSDANFATSDRTGCSCQSDQPTLLTPKKGATIDVGSASVGESVSYDVFVSGAMLTKTVACTLSGTNANLFMLSSAALPATNVNSGTTLKVTYSPTATGSHTATLTFSSSELTERTITLTGESKAELVTPVSGDEFRFNTEGIGDVAAQQIKVKGTNLSAGLYIGIASGGPASFSVSPASLTAAQANAGATITVTYKPTKLGEESTQLIVNSTGKEFTMPSLKLYGSCAFAVKEPTDITSSLATLNWVNAGVKKYIVDVFFLSQEEDPEVTILDDDAGSKASSKTSTYTDVKGYIRLGSGSAIGSITYNNVNLSKASTMTIVAKSYQNDADVKCKLTINGKDTTLALTNSDVTYTIAVPAASATSTVQLASMATGKRVLIKNVKITTGGTKEVRTHLQGYPMEETYLYHTVQNLLPETEYTYTIQPEGQPESEKLTFTTDSTSTTLPTALYPLPSTPSKFLQDDHLYLRHGEHVYSADGQPIY